MNFAKQEVAHTRYLIRLAKARRDRAAYGSVKAALESDIIRAYKRRLKTALRVLASQVKP